MLPQTRPAWLDEVQRPPRSIPDNATRPAPLLFDAENQPIETPEQWEARREAIRQRWSEFLVEYPVPVEPPTLEVLEEDHPEGVIRQRVRYEAEPGLPVQGYLLRPDEPGEGRPGAAVFHSTVNYTIRQPAGLEGPEAKHIGIHLARRGYVAFCPENFLWQYGQAGKIQTAVDWLQTTDEGITAQVRDRHGRVTGMAKMLFDAIRAVDVLASQADVAPHRLGSIGHSLGAKEVLYLAAFDPRIRATVSSEGGIGISYSNWDAPWYLGPDVHRPGFDLDHAQVLSLIAPRAFLLLGGDSADGDQSWPYIEAALPVWKLMNAPEAVGLFNHRQGHEYPPEAQERAYEWLDWFLRA